MVKLAAMVNLMVNDSSGEVQNKFLILSKCNAKLCFAGFDPVPCSNTTQTVREIKACYGKHLDGRRRFGVDRRNGSSLPVTGTFAD